MATLGQRLKEARRARGLNMEDAAREFFGVNRPVYASWEKDHSIPTKVTRKQIAEFMQTTEDEVRFLMAARVGYLEDEEVEILLDQKPPFVDAPAREGIGSVRRLHNGHSSPKSEDEHNCPACGFRYRTTIPAAA